jgi:hypothetical protein
MRAVILGGIALLVLVVGLIWLSEMLRANKIARRDFGPVPCWFVQKESGQSPPGLMPGPRGFYLPNPFQQLNRRFIGLGVADSEVLALHFAVSARDASGAPNLWGWSYRERRFFALPLPGEQSSNGFYNAIESQEILAACPDLPDAKLTEGQP